MTDLDIKRGRKLYENWRQTGGEDCVPTDEYDDALDAWGEWVDDNAPALLDAAEERDQLLMDPANRLDGYRELGQRVANAESASDGLRARIAELESLLHDVREDEQHARLHGVGELRHQTLERIARETGGLLSREELESRVRETNKRLRGRIAELEAGRVTAADAWESGFRNGQRAAYGHKFRLNPYRKGES